MRFPENTVLMTGAGFDFTRGNASTNLSVELARAYRELGLSPFVVPQNPSFAGDEPRAGSFETIPYTYPMKRKNVFRGFGKWRDRLNYRLCLAVNPLVTARMIWRNRRRLSHVFSETLPPTALAVLAVTCRCSRVPLIYHVVEEPWTLSVNADIVAWRRLIRVMREAIPILLFYLVILRLTTVIACITEEMVLLLRKWGYPDEKLIRLPNVRFIGVTDSREGCSRDMRTREETCSIPFVLYCGEISHTKEAFGPLIEAMRRININGPRLALRIYGRGGTEAISRIRKLAAKTGMTAEAIQFFGFVEKSELHVAQDESLVCLLLKRDVPFNHYNFPTKLIDYLAAGKPVLMSHLPLHLRYFRHGVDALIVNPESADEIRLALEWALANPQQLAAIGSGARQKLAEHFCAVQNVRGLLAEVKRHGTVRCVSGGYACGTWKMH